MSLLPSLASIVKGSTAIKAVIGTNPIRFYPFGSAPQGTAKPYVTELVVDGVPENTLSETPAVDGCRVQLSVWAATGSAAEALALLFRDAIEPTHHILSIRNMGRDPETMTYRVDLDVSVFNHR